MMTYGEAREIEQRQFFDLDRNTYLLRRKGTHEWFCANDVTFTPRLLEHAELMEYTSQKLKHIDIDLRTCECYR
jgi:hypothetical protein